MHRCQAGFAGARLGKPTVVLPTNLLVQLYVGDIALAA